MSDTYTRTVDKSEVPALAAAVLAQLREAAASEAVVLALHGDLGAGKTTFVQALAAALSITEPVTSPTFTIMKSYETADDTFETLVHMDAYRIESENELRPLRFAELLATPRTLVCIEWAEKITANLPPHTTHISFAVHDETTRIVTMSAPFVQGDV